MPFPTRYTPIVPIADDADDIYIDQQRGHVWVLSGGGYEWHNDTEPDGPTIYKFNMSDGALLASGRGPFVAWNYEDSHTSPENIANNFEVWSIAVAPTSGNLYVSTYNRFTGPGIGRIYCLDPNTLATLFTSPDMTGTFNRPATPLIVEPYIYYHSGVRAGSPPLRLAVSRLPLTLTQVDWTAIVYSGVDTFELTRGGATVDSAGNVWYGNLATLGKVSPTGTVTTYSLAGTHANTCIQYLAYDAVSNNVLILANLRTSNGTGSFVAPYNMLIRVNAATGAVNGTYSPPTNGYFLVVSDGPQWQFMQDGRVWLRMSGDTAIPVANRFALVDFDIRTMRPLRTYRLSQDWNLSAVADPTYGDSELHGGQRAQMFIPDLSTRSVWVYNAFNDWLYPSGDGGTYGVWQWSLNECSTYIHYSETNYAYQRIYFDREHSTLWHMANGGVEFVKLHTTTGTITYQGPAPGIPASPNWNVTYLGVSQQTGDIYINEDSGSVGTVRCLSGADLTLKHTSPATEQNIKNIWVRDPYVFALDGGEYDNSGESWERMRLSRYPLDLSSRAWVVQLYNVYVGDGVHTVFDGQAAALDGDGNFWLGLRTDLLRVSPNGALSVYSVSGQISPLFGDTINSVGWDSDANVIVFLYVNRDNQRSNILGRFSCTTLTVLAWQANADWNASFNGGSEPNNWERLPNGRLWMRLRGSTLTTPPAGDFAEIDTRTLTEVRRFSLISDWCITNTTENKNALDKARFTSGYLWDDCTCCLWLYNAYGLAYANATWPNGAYGVWKLPLPDQPALDCPTVPVVPCPEPAWLEQFHDVVLDPYISYGCKIRIKFQTYITKMRQGHEERIGEWQDPIWTFDITPALRDQADLDYLLAFFRARQGPLYVFKFLNPLDYQVQGEVFGYGDGTETQFQLSRRYSTGLPGDTASYVRPIILPDVGVQVYDNEVLVEEGLYTLCPLGGVVIFPAAPAAGHTLSWSGMYYTPVRFLNGRVYSTVEHYQHYEDQIMLVEERLLTSALLLQEDESGDFVEVRFPERYAQRASMGPEIDVITITSDSGGTFRQLQFQSAKIRFTVEETEQPQAVVASLLAFFLNRKGRLYGFRARDITDFSLGGSVLEAADGTRTEFQIVKKYSSAAQTSVRAIFKPNTDVIVAIDGSPAAPQPTVSTQTGIITFASPPAAGVAITCTGTFDVPVRFNADEAVFSIQGFEAFSMESMTLLETELGLPTFTIEPLVPTTMAVQAQAAPLPRLAMPGQESCQLPPRPAVTAYLEFRGGTTGSGAGTYSGLQVERPGSMYRLLAGASSLTVAFLVSHVKSGTPSGVPGAVYPMALFSHVMPGMGTDAALYPSTGFTLYLANFGAGVALDASIGAYKYATSGALCVPQLNLTPRVPAQGAQSATAVSDNNLMHAYVVTFDWVSHQAYWSGTIYGSQDFPPEAFVYNTCFAGVGGADARLLEATATQYLGARDLTIGQGETANDGWLGVVGQAPQTPAFHSPLSAFVYEHLFLPTFTRVDKQRMLRDVHAPILRYWGSKYSTGYANVQSPVAPGFDLFWWRAGENVQVADTPTGAIATWAPVVCGFQWHKANLAALQDDGQPRLHAVTTLPVLSDVLMLADGRRLLARQT